MKKGAATTVLIAALMGFLPGASGESLSQGVVVGRRTGSVFAKGGISELLGTHDGIAQTG